MKRNEIIRDGMRELIVWAWRTADEKDFGKDDHHTLYHLTAIEFGLYDGDKNAPIWLSRVVAGVLQDRDDGFTEVSI